MSQDQNGRNTSARAPGSNGPGSVPSDPSGPQDGIAEVQTSPGDPLFSEKYGEQQRTGTKPYDAIPSTEPARPVVRHHNKTESIGTGKLITESGARLPGARNHVT